MSLDLNSLRVYALGLAHHAVGDINRDNFCQLRNYVDMCAFLCNTDQRRNFFDQAQEALEKTDSLYYPLIQRTLATVSEDGICTFGVNLGIDALTCGASELKKVAQETQQPVYWLTVASEDDPGLDAHITAGEKNGEFLWILHSPAGTIENAAELSKAHPKSDFAVLLSPEAITPETTACFALHHNMIPILCLSQPEIDETLHSSVELLKEQKIFYGLTVALTEETIGSALDKEWLDVLAQHTLFCAYTHPDVTPEKAEELRSRIYRTRTTTGSPVLLFDWEADTIGIGKFIHKNAQVEYLAR
jgi:hypothetical protein